MKKESGPVSVWVTTYSPSCGCHNKMDLNIFVESSNPTCLYCGSKWRQEGEYVDLKRRQ